jgi:tetratricopeptide (TPR) repeat protein
LLEAAFLQSKGEFREALTQLRAARTLCQLSHLPKEEALVHLSLGSTYFAQNNERGALASYAACRALGQRVKDPALEAQGLLGAAAVHFSKARYREAAAAYGELSELVAGKPGPLRALWLEAQRMRGECLKAQGQAHESLVLWQHTLSLATALPDAERAVLSVDALGKALAALWREGGHQVDAQRVEAEVAAFREPKPKVEEI